MSLYSQIESARAAYQNSREKDFKKKAQAALKVLGIKANDGTRDREIYEGYLRYAPFSNTAEKVAAIEGIASRPAEVSPRLPSTYAAVYQAIKREIRRRKDDGEQVPATLPRQESTKAEK